MIPPVKGKKDAAFTEIFEMMEQLQSAYVALPECFKKIPEL